MRREIGRLKLALGPVPGWAGAVHSGRSAARGVYFGLARDAWYRLRSSIAFWYSREAMRRFI
jgi:hypothetical protein